MKILFLDDTCYKPYSLTTLQTEPLGGTEATVVRVATALAGRGHQVCVMQHLRKESITEEGVEYAPASLQGSFRPTHVVALRTPQRLQEAKISFPNAKLFIWAHDLFTPQWATGFQALINTNTLPIVVSDFHKAQMYEVMRSINFQGSIPSRRIYNPIAESLQYDPQGGVDKTKLVFFSSPHKGLDHTLKIFERFQDFEELRDMRLYVANPGYFEDKKIDQRNVINLGALPHHEVINHVRNALCVFHLNAVYPETFGLVHAEANAVGTPFINHRVGAVPETIDHPAELIDVNDPKKVIDRIIEWKTLGRPRVRAYPGFRISRIVKEWEEVLAL